MTEKSEDQESLEESTRRVKFRLLCDVSFVARLNLTGMKWERADTSCPGSASRGLFQRGRWGSLCEGCGGSFPRIVSELRGGGRHGSYYGRVGVGVSHGSDLID